MAYKPSKIIGYPTPQWSHLFSPYGPLGVRKLAPTTRRVNRPHSLTETGKGTPKDTGGRPKVVSGLGARWARGGGG